jgi:hypothetical protein
VLPVGGPGDQVLQVWQRYPGGFYSENLLSVSFVPLRGGCGWSESDWPEKQTKQ